MLQLAGLLEIDASMLRVGSYFVQLLQRYLTAHESNVELAFSSQATLLWVALLMCIHMYVDQGYARMMGE